MKFDPKVPPVLFEMQQWFASIEKKPLRKLGRYQIPIYSSREKKEIEKRILPGPSLSASERIGIYNQQYWWRFFVLLQERYPSLVRLFGYVDFNHLLAEPYLIQRPPSHWSLSRFGIDLPEWMEKEYRDADRDIAIALAQIDRSYEKLSWMPALPVAKGGGRLFLQPFVFLFSLEANFFSFRQSLLNEDISYWEVHPFPVVDWEEKPLYFALFRKGKEIGLEALSEKEYAILFDLQFGKPFSQEMEKWAFRGWLTRQAPLFIERPPSQSH